jgi:hypothetical protein
MAVKFSQFVVETDKANVNYLVGWDGTENVQITPANLLGSHPSGSGAAGQVAFFDSASSITGDNDFYWDNVNKRLGIGTTSPAYKLDVVKDAGNAIINLERTGTNSGKTLFSVENQGRLRVISEDSIRFLTPGGERIRIEAGGNVGIGTTSPSAKLEVDGTFIATGISQLGSGGSNVYLTSSSAGNVGIGTSSPSQKLHVFGTTRISGTNNLDIFSDNTAATFNLASNARGFLFKNLNGDLVTINSSGNVGIGTTSPSVDLEIGTSGSADTEFLMQSDQAGKYFKVSSSGNFTELKSVGDQNLFLNSAGAGGYVSFLAGNSERMRINYDGNVGIGATSPTKKLDVRGDVIIAADTPVSPIGVTGLEVYNNAGQAQLMIHQDDGNQESVLHMRCGGNDTKIKTGPNTWALKIDTENVTDAIALMSTSGNLGIGTTSPSEKLDVVGNINLDGTSTRVFFGGNNTFVGENSNSNELILRGGGSTTAESVYIDTSGNVGAGTSSPNAKLNVISADETVARFERNSGSGFAAIDIKDSVGTTGNSAIRFSDTTATSGEINYEHADDSLRISTSSSEKMRITSSGNVGIGVTSPASKLEVDGGDIEVDDSASGLILRSPDGTRYRVTVANGGTLSVSAV